MLITCPTCASSYRIDAAKIGPEGRSVRCAACRETWFLTPDAAIEEAPEPGLGPSDEVSDAAWAEAAAAVRETAEPEAPSEEPKPNKRKSPPRKGRKTAKANPFAAKGFLSPPAILGLALLAALPVACLARTGLVGLVPQTASVFAAIGLPVNRRGLEIRDVVAFQNPGGDEGSAELVVEGDLVGVGRANVPVPGLRIEISDAAGKVIKSFPASAPKPNLANGESARFRAKLTDPPAQGRAVMLRFADATTAKR